MKLVLLTFFCFLLFAGCSKVVDAPKETCFIPYIDFVVYNVNPNTLEVSFNSISSFNGEIKKHHWDFGDGTTFDGPVPPPHKYPTQSSASGNNYRVKYTVANECGEAYWTKEVTISPCLPNVRFTSTRLSDSSVRFRNQTLSGSPATYEWTFGDGTKSTSNATDITKAYQFDGNYVVTLKATNACGDNFFTDTVFICKKPVPSQHVQLGNCGTVNINASATKNGELYQWDFGNGAVLPATPSPNATISYTYPSPGNYVIKLKVVTKNRCDSAVLSTPVTIQSIGIVPNRNWSYTSDDLQFRFRRNAVTNATSYKWDFGDGTTSTEQNPDKLYNTPGNYTITMIAANACASDTFKTTISAPFYKQLGNAPNVVMREVVAVSAQEIYFLSNNGSLYKTDTAGTWSASIPLPAGLSFNENTKLYKDLNNRLWIYGRGQIARFNPASNTWTLLFGSTGYKNNVTIEGMAVDAAGNIWTIADNEVRRNATELNVSGNNNFSSIAFAPGTNRIWITADNRSNLYYATPTGNQITSVTNAGIIGGADNISIAGDGSLFFTSAQSIISANSNGVFIRSYNIATTGGLLTGNPDDYSLDNEGNIWVVQGGRLIKIPVQNPGASRNYSYNSTLNGFSSLDIIQISGTDNDIFLTKTTGNAAIHIK